MATKAKPNSKAPQSKAKPKVVAPTVFWQPGQDAVRVQDKRLELRNLLKMTRSDFQRLVNVSERTIAKVEESAEPAKKLQRTYVEVLRLCGALAQVVDSNALGAWFKAPNQLLSGRTPMEVIEHGEIDRLWEIVYRLRSGMPG
jgi:DNA-binding XRE family transcriptional regulator